MRLLQECFRSVEGPNGFFGTRRTELLLGIKKDIFLGKVRSQIMARKRTFGPELDKRHIYGLNVESL